jgi:AbiV family abortive infection protein
MNGTSTFLNLSPKDSKGFDKPLYKNALSLKRDAILIAEKRKSYSSASSLLILSTEECVKSILVLLHSENYKIYRIKEAKNIFSDHVFRHHIAMLIEVALTIFENWYKKEQSKKNKLFNSKIKLFENLKNIIVLFDKILKTKANVDYLQEFNNIKNKGFYVDYRDGLIDPNIEVTIIEYNKILKITNRVFKFNKLLRILFHKKIENHMEKVKIVKWEENIREFIDHGMTVFSSKELRKNSL